MPLEEASYRMRSAPEEDLARYQNGQAMSERIREWLATPEGSVAHDPSWGHRLDAFKFSPLSKGNGLETLIELSITRKLPLDVEDITILAVKVDVLDIDMFLLTIVHQFGVERAHQEGFIDTALNRSSILAHGEGREYMPRKPSPATGKAVFFNQGEYSFTLLRGYELMSDAQVVYTLEETVVVGPRESVSAVVSQRSKSILEFSISEEKPFYELLLGQDISPRIVSFKVFVQEEGQEFEEWEYSRLLTNSYPESHVYDEFYHFTDQIGIRFGNGDFGKILPQGTKVRVELVLTEGDTILLEKQSLWPVEEIRDANGLSAQYQITVSQTIQNGEAQEGTEEMRRNLHYAPVYNERLVWDNDYEYFLRRRFPEIVFTRAWGEEEAEKMWGYNVEHINRIWISAYSPERDIRELAMKAIHDVPMMCRNFQWYEPEHIEFWLVISGRILEDRLLSEAEEAIRDVLLNFYGKASRSRRDNVLLHEIYEAIYSTGFFEKESGAWFEVEIHGKQNADLIYQMVSINMDRTAVQLAYL